MGLTVLIQGAGAASVLLATVVLGAVAGPAQQAMFSRFKAEIEFTAAMAMFGLPQALFFYVKSQRLTLQAALNWALVSALAAVCAGIAYGLARDERDLWQVGAAGIAIGLYAAQGQLRALLLGGEKTTWFNVITALPQGLLLAGVCIILMIASDGAFVWPALFIFAYGVAAAMGLCQLRRASWPSCAASTIGWRDLARYGMAAWLLAMMSTAAVLFAQHWVQQARGITALGVFTMAMTLVQVPLVPLNYATPLLLRRWIERPNHRSIRLLIGTLTIALFLAASAVGLLAIRWPGLGFGSAYDGVAMALAVLLVGAAGEAIGRVLTVSAYASGLPWVAAWAEVAKWSVLLMGWLLLPDPGILLVCATWAVASFAAAAVLFADASFRTKRQRMRQ